MCVCVCVCVYVCVLRYVGGYLIAMYMNKHMYNKQEEGQG